MEISRPLSDHRATRTRALQRAAIVGVLVRICGNIENLHGDEEWRRACREVASALRQWCKREEARTEKADRI